VIKTIASRARGIGRGDRLALNRWIKAWNGGVEHSVVGEVDPGGATVD